MRAYEFIREDNADYDEDRYLKSDPGTPLSFPKGTTLVNVSDVYDWYKLGMAVSDLDDADPRTFNKGVPHTVFAFGSEEEEHRMIPLLKRLGFSLHDIDSPEDYKKAIRASDVMEHLEEMVERQVINDDELPDLGKDTRVSNDWTQQIGVDSGSGYQRAQGNLPTGVNLSIAADAAGPASQFMPQRGVNIAKGPASLYLGDRGAVSGSYNIPIDKDSSVSLSASGQKDFGVTGVGAQYQRKGFSAGVNQPNFPGAKPQFNVGYSAQFEEAELEEMAGTINVGISQALAKKGYQYLGGGIDKQAYLEPGTGQVLIVFGYRKGQKDFSPDQRMFIDWITYCNKNANNPHLPKFSGFESFQFGGQNYIQARMEPLRELPDEVGDLVGQLDQVTKKKFKDYRKPLRTAAQYATFQSAEMGNNTWYELEDVIEYLGGEQAAEALLQTVYQVQKFAKKHRFSIDLHRGNYMQRPDGTIVVNDPFVLWLTSSGNRRSWEE
jgi:hypothetical protein